MPESATRTKPKPARPTSNTALARRVDELTARLEALEGIIKPAIARQQKAAAAKLAQNPEQLAQLKSLLELAEST